MGPDPPGVYCRTPGAPRLGNRRVGVSQLGEAAHRCADARVGPAARPTGRPGGDPARSDVRCAAAARLYAAAPRLLSLAGGRKARRHIRGRVANRRARSSPRAHQGGSQRRLTPSVAHRSDPIRNPDPAVHRRDTVSDRVPRYPTPRGAKGLLPAEDRSAPPLGIQPDLRSTHGSTRFITGSSTKLATGRGDVMIVAVHQPQYLPWLGYFDKMDQCDLFVFLDSVQFKKNEWQNRNRIKTASDWQYLTVPVQHRFPQAILDVQIDNRADWARKHLQALMVHYGKAPYFADHLPFLLEVYAKRWASLCELCIVLIQYLTAVIGITVKVVRSSEGQFSEEPTERLIEICRWAGADAYLAGAGGLNYMRLDRFRQEGIQVVQQAFEPPIYPQLYGRFEPNLSVVDLLFNCGPASLEILRGSRKGTRPTGPSSGKEEA